MLSTFEINHEAKPEDTCYLYLLRVHYINCQCGWWNKSNMPKTTLILKIVRSWFRLNKLCTKTSAFVPKTFTIKWKSWLLPTPEVGNQSRLQLTSYRGIFQWDWSGYQCGKRNTTTFSGEKYHCFNMEDGCCCFPFSFIIILSIMSNWVYK